MFPLCHRNTDPPKELPLKIFFEVLKKFFILSNFEDKTEWNVRTNKKKFFLPTYTTFYSLGPYS